MSNTIKQAILSLKSRIADAYTAIAAKGGTMPATQDSANLPTAIESIPGKGDYDIISGIRLSDDPSDPSAPTRPLPDGMSLAQLLCKGYGTNLTDDNTWTLDRTDAIGNMLIIFTSLETLQLGCNLSTTNKALGNAPQSLKKLVFRNLKKIEYTNDSLWFIYNSNNIEEIEFPELLQAKNVLRWYGNNWWRDCFAALTKLSLPKLEIVDKNGAALIGGGCPSLTRLELPMLHTLNGNLFGGQVLRNLTELRMPSLTKCNNSIQSNRYPGTNAYDDLLLLEVGAVETSLKLNWWTAVNVLQNNLQQFLLNFRDYIALRLTANGSGLTLTLSQEVRDAIQQDPEIVSIITGKGWTISPAPTA